MRKIKKDYEPVDLSEVGQRSKQKIQLANVTGGAQVGQVCAISRPFKCREFYSDMLFTLNTGLRCSMYGFDTDHYKKWKGNYLISTYAEPADSVLEKLKIMNTALKGTVPQIEFEQLDMEDQLSSLGTPEETSGFLVKNPAWWNKTLIRGSVFTALLRTLSYKNPLDIGIEESYAEACVTQMHKKSFPTLEPYNDTLWNLIFFPALKLTYNNCICISDKGYKDILQRVKDGSNCSIHSTTGIYTMWNTLFQYMSRPEPMKTFKDNTNEMFNKDLLGNMLAFEADARKETNAG